MPATTSHSEPLSPDQMMGLQSDAAALLNTAALTLRPDGRPFAPPSACGDFYRRLIAQPSGVRWLVAALAEAAAEALRRNVVVPWKNSAGLSALVYPIVTAEPLGALAVLTSPGIRPDLRGSLAAELGFPPGSLITEVDDFDASRVPSGAKIIERAVHLTEQATRGQRFPAEAELKRNRILIDATRALSGPLSPEAVLAVAGRTLTGVLHMERATPFERDGDVWISGEPVSAWGEAIADAQTMQLDGLQSATLEHGAILELSPGPNPRATRLIVPIYFRGLQALMLVESDHSAKPPSQSELEVAALVGHQAGAALWNARHADTERNLAHTLRETLRSRASSDLGGVRVDARYEPAVREANVGGDFYDAFMLPGGQVAVVVGDVVGKGVEAAIQTNIARFTLRAYALMSADPAEILSRTNDALVRYEETRGFLTAALVVLDPATGTLHYASAGHCAMFLYRRGADAVGVLDSTGTVLGAIGGLKWESNKVKWSAGDALVLYTDGIIEAHPPDSLEMFGTEGVRRVLMEHRHETGDHLVQAIYDEASDHAEGVQHDDCAVLVVSNPAPPEPGKNLAGIMAAQFVAGLSGT